MIYRTAAKQLEPFEVGDIVRLYNGNKPFDITGVVAYVTSSLVGVDLDGGGYFQCDPHRWRKSCIRIRKQ